MADNGTQDKLGYRAASWKSWLLSPYLLYIGIAVLVIWYITGNARTHFASDSTERAKVTFEEGIKQGLPGDDFVTEFPAGQTFEILARQGGQWILEDPATGVRFTRVVPEKRKTPYTISGNTDALRKLVSPTFHSYVKADDVKNVFIGRNISDVVKEIGDYNEGNPAKGYYYFRYLTPVTGSVRHESGVVFTTDADGVITASDEADPESTSSNLFGKLPFYSDIVSWNLITHGVNSLVSQAEPKEEKGWLSLFLGWIWGFVWGLCKIVIMFVIIGLIFFLPATAIVAVTGPMVRVAKIKSSTIRWINCIAVIPLEYILFISFTDYFHTLWWIAGPIFLCFAIGAVSAIEDMTSARRCTKCGAIDSHYTESKVLDVREKVRLEETVNEDRNLKYKGYSLKTMSDQWEQEVRYRTWRITTIETDTQYDTYCHNCDYHVTRVSTTKKTKRELWDRQTEKRRWVPKD